jgi:hypothetical protein
MERDEIDEWSRSLPLPGRRRRSIARELRAHLADSRRELELAGWHPEAAATESLRRLGDPTEMAEGFVRVHRRPRRATIGLAFGLATALMLGIYGASGTFASASSPRPHATHAHVTQSTHGKQPARPAVKRQG